jgi:hypothetical protein
MINYDLLIIYSTHYKPTEHLKQKSVSHTGQNDHNIQHPQEISRGKDYERKILKRNIVFLRE